MGDTEQQGPFKPLSLDPPTPQDIELSDRLMAELKAQKNFESPEEGKQRLEIATNEQYHWI
jgi:poly(A) polymerase